MPSSRTPEQTLQRALAHHERGELEQAEVIYRQILAANPDNADALNLLARVAHQTGHHAQAAELVERAIQINPKDAHYHCNLGDIASKLPDLNRAIASYRCA